MAGPLTAWRHAEDTGTGAKKKRPADKLPAECGCQRRIWTAHSTYEGGPILCPLCETEFVPELPDDEEQGRV